MMKKLVFCCLLLALAVSAQAVWVPEASITATASHELGAGNSANELIIEGQLDLDLENLAVAGENRYALF